MTPVAAVILAHADPTQVRRLIGALNDVPIYLHCDAKSSSALYDQMAQNLPSRVVLCERRRTSVASWSLVDAELGALRAAVKATSAQHIVVLSGADYPLLPMHALADALAPWQGASYLWNVPLPFAPWDTSGNPDGGLSRMSRRVFTWRDQVLFVRGVPLRWPIKRDIPRGLELRAASQWKIYSRHHIQILLDVADKRPDLIRFWRSTLVPDESFAASILASRSLVGSDALPVCYDDAWYLDWSEGHPKFLGSAEFDKLVLARHGTPATPVTAAVSGGESRSTEGKLFARKFSTTASTDVLARIDDELRV